MCTFHRFDEKGHFWVKNNPFLAQKLPIVAILSSRILEKGNGRGKANFSRKSWLVNSSGKSAKSPYPSFSWHQKLTTISQEKSWDCSRSIKTNYLVQSIIFDTLKPEALKWPRLWPKMTKNNQKRPKLSQKWLKLSHFRLKPYTGLKWHFFKWKGILHFRLTYGFRGSGLQRGFGLTSYCCIF